MAELSRVEIFRLGLGGISGSGIGEFGTQKWAWTFYPIRQVYVRFLGGGVFQGRDL